MDKSKIFSSNYGQFEEDKFQDECGVFGVFDIQDASAHTALGLHALQHRGQESCGIVSFENKFFIKHKMGLVCDSLNKAEIIKELPGKNAIGHVRYSTTGSSDTKNIQPIYSEFKDGAIAIAHNGNLTNARKIKEDLIKKGMLFESTTDTEVINHLIANAPGDIIEKIIYSLQIIKGAYSLILLTENYLVAVRDPNGVRPLVIGKLADKYVIASESCALDIIGAEFLRDVEAGEMVIINTSGLKSIKPFKNIDPRFCIFEYVYFARPDSIIESNQVYEVRKNIGRELAKEAFFKADMVVPVPDSGVPAALGYAQETSIPFELGIIRNHYVGRTFIEPTDQIRNLGVKLKHNASKIVKDKSIILVDDSIVRGTTSKKIVNMLREAGAREIHMRIASPPTVNSCFYGIDTPDRSKLIAANYTISEICSIIGADSLEFISLDGLYRAVTGKDKNILKPLHCDACLGGEYFIDLEDFA